MKDNENLKESPAPRFSSQWRPNTARLRGQVFTKPTCTVPDQSMSISEIIARFTRTGLVPQSYARRDDGGNTAVEPDFDPLDEYSEVMAMQASRQAAAQAAARSGAASGEAAPGLAVKEPVAPSSGEPSHTGAPA